MLQHFLRPEVLGTTGKDEENGTKDHQPGQQRPTTSRLDSQSLTATDTVSERPKTAEPLDLVSISATYKETAVLFPDAHQAAFEPKVQVPFEFQRGRIPREIEIERRRRLYESKDVSRLVQVAGLTLKLLAHKSSQELPLQVFDDTSYDSRIPAEWMEIAAQNENPAGRYLPAEGIYEFMNSDFRMRPCRVIGWDVARNEVKLLWGAKPVPDETPVVVPRFHVRLLAEDPVVYVERLVNAQKQRVKAMAWIRYRLCCDAMPTDGLPGLDSNLSDRLLRLGTGIPNLNKAVFPDVDERAQRLIAELTLEWQRSHNRILLQDLMQRDESTLRMVANTTQMSLQELVRGPNVEIRRTIKSDPSSVIPIGDFDFAERERSFTFSTYYTQPEVVTALTGVRSECMKVLEGSLFNLPKARQMQLSEFQKLQRDHMAAVEKYLKGEWTENICNVIRNSFVSAGKGWLNVHESKQEIYEISKLKKFFTTVKFMMEDTLFDLVYTSLQDFTVFFEEVSEFTVNVIDMNNVENKWPGSDADDCVEKQPLFTIRLAEQDGSFTYSISFKDFEEAIIDLFFSAIQCTDAIPQVEKFVMSQYFWRREGEGPFLDSVKQQEERVCLLRDRVRHALQNSMKPLRDYLQTYDDLLPLVRLDKKVFITEYAAQEHTMEEMKEEIRAHLKAKKVVAQKLPAFITVGNYVVDCQSFGQIMASKEHELAKLVMNLICKIAKTKTSYIREEFTKIVRVVEKQPQTPEKLYELKAIIVNTPERISELSAEIEEMRQYYNVLDGFQYELSDEESRQKWEAISWPRQLTLRIQETNKQLEKVEEELHARLQKEAEEFSKKVDALQRVVATFSKYTDATEAEKVAAEVKVNSIEIRKCIEQARSINSDQRLFGDKLTDYRSVFELEKEFKPYSDLWLTTYQWQDCYRRWHADPFDSLDHEEIDTVVTNAFKTMTQLSKTFKDKNATLKIVSEIRGKVEAFKKWVPIVTSLRQPGMKERHWKGLSEKLNLPLVPGETILLMEDLEPLLGFKDVIVPHCEVAAKEAQIEKALKDMRAKWESRVFIIEPYKESNTYIIKDSSEIVELLDEHLNLTQQLQFSPFKAYYAEAITDWERSLNLISDIIEQWLECQRAWRYLEPIFNAKDIALQLPRLTKLFDRVDKTWRRVMGTVHHQPNVLDFCIGTSKLLESLRESNRILEEVQRGLNDYLAEKRQSFPRFYFLSDEELLEILSQSKEVRRIDAHISKLFEFIQRLSWTENNEINGFFSGEGEHVPSVNVVYPEGNVEMWLGSVETMMKEAVAEQLRQSFYAYSNTPRAKWVLEWAAQCVIAVSQIFWTNGCEEGLVAEKSVENYFRVLEHQLFELVDVVQSPLNARERINMGALITVEVHAKDTVEAMTRHKVDSIQSFEWIKQLRFYFDTDDRMCHIKQVDAHFVYGGEYLGNTGRLVVTPLTDRIYLTLTGALALCLGGAPAGPAGTGKTETTKDLAKALAKQCVVFNCQEGMTCLSMAKFFKGLAWAGAWACFDEFNRIDVEVLSVVAQQVTDLQQACVTKQYRIVFEGSEVVVDPTHAVFITMNPGYAGRTELPDNLKVLFRPVACMVPDYAMIGEIRLFSYGYKKARSLAQKMVMTFKLSSEQLSSQDHYDFGMRAVNTVISAAGLNKRENPNEDEDLLLLRALRDSNAPKFLKDDIILFEGIISDLFPGTKLSPTEYGVVVDSLRQVVTSSQLQPVPGFIEKCLQLYDVTTLRHGLMLVGPAGSGKTMAYTSLQKALSGCSVMQSKGQDVGARDYMKVFTHICNPKAVTMDQLYGAYDENGEWKDGVLCVLFRRAAKYGDEGNQIGKHWVMFDGPVDALWIESMNTVLDENKKLCLVSGEIIQMSRDMTMMFEVEDLAVASPATVSRCGMIYMEPTACVPTQALTKSWKERLPKYVAPQADYLEQLVELYVDELIEYVRANLREYVPSTNVILVHSFFRMMDGYIESFGGLPGQRGPPTLSPERLEIMAKCITPLFFMAITWSIGATCDEVGREKFADMLREMATRNNHADSLPESGSVYDYCFVYYPSPDDDEEARWTHWDELRATCDIARTTKFEDVLVPTIDNTRQKYVLTHLLERKVNVVAVGPTGTGKSVAAGGLVMNGISDRLLGLAFSFTPQTKAGVLQDSLMSKFDKRRSHVYGAPVGKHFLVFIDDANLPQKERYGAQPPLELLRQLLGHGGLYSFVGGIKWNLVIDTSFVMAMGPPGGSRTQVSNRLMRYFNYVSFPEMSEASKRTILNTILKGGLHQRGVKEEVVDFITNLVDGTLNVFKRCRKAFVPTPSHVHYSFNMRDVMRVFPMIYINDTNSLPNRDVLLKQWVHEMQRVFCDRLICNEDREEFLSFIDDEIIQIGYEGGYKSLLPDGRLIFGDFMSTGERSYQQITDMDALAAFFNEQLLAYNNANENPMGLVLFLDAIEHVCRITRVLSMPNGHCLLLGIGGSGRKSLTRLACFLIPEMDVFTIEFTKNFGVKEWREALARLLLDCGKDGKKRTFLFSDTQIINQTLMEDVAALLTAGDVPNLFEDQDIEIINERFKGVCMSENLPTTKVSMYARFIKEVRSNLHIVLAFSPIGEVFRTRLRMFPALITCCTIDWFAEWPGEALLSVARAQLQSAKGDLGDDEGDRLSRCFKSLHLSAAETTERFFVETHRRSYITPTSYLSLLNTYISLVESKRKFGREQASRLENGLEKLYDTEVRVVELEGQLKAQQPVLEMKKLEIRGIMEKLRVDRKDAAEKEASARTEEVAATTKAEECARMRRECASRLAEAEPALQEAVKVLSKIKAAEISELNKYQNPPKGVQYVMEAVALLLTFGNCPKEFYSGPPGGKKTPDWWLCAKSYMKNANQLLDTLVQPPGKGGFDREAMDMPLIEKVRTYYENDEFQPEKVKSVSVPCMAMCQWVRAMYKWFFVNREIQPLRERLADAERELKRVNRALAETRRKLDAVVEAVAKLEKEFEDAMATQTALENEVEQTSEKLQRAARLIAGLGGEKVRWKELVEQYKVKDTCVSGDMVIAAASIAYFGPLTGPYRKHLLQTWSASLAELGIKTSENSDLLSTTGDAVQIHDWQLCGLPKDPLSTENAIILSNARTWPLLIDPQGQANSWIRNLHKDDNLQVCKASDDKFMKTVEGAIRLGLPCLLENVGESLDPALEPVLHRNVFLIGCTPHIRVGDSAIPYNEKFRLYMTTKLPNPSYTPETIVIVSLLNFFITRSGLEDQILARTVEKERNDLEQEKQRLTRDCAEKNRELKELQENILRMLEEAEGDILDQEELIDALEKSKLKSTEISEDLVRARATEVTIDETRNKYRPHAYRGALLFFCVSELSTVDPMYQFSLQWYINLVLLAIENTEAAVDIEERVEKLIEFFTYSFYTNVCRSLFERHKLTFSFFLCTSILQQQDELDGNEYHYLLTGPTGSGGEEPNPAPDWLTENSWNEIQFVSSNLPNFAGFAEHVTQCINYYKELFDSLNAHTYPLAAEWQGRETPLQRLVVVRCFRRDKVASAIQEFVKHYMGERFIIVPQFDLMDAYKDSTCLTPLIFIISPGSDPMNDLLRFAEHMRMSKKLDKVSLGQGQGRKAEELLSNGRERGQWVLLQNCHLATSWMPTLEAIVESFTLETVRKEFRLWLTSMPSDSFPVAVLQISVKMTNEPPMGLRANVTRSYYGLTDDDLEHPTKPNQFKKMVFAFCLFHAVIQERRKFGSLGFNIAYEFNDSDRNVCLLQLRKFISLYEDVPFDVLTFLTGEINYGGRVTDDWDRRCMMALIKDFITPGVLEEGYSFSPSGTYHTVEACSRAFYLDYLGTWPLNPEPEVFGLSDNADITCAQSESASILATILSLVSRESSGSSHQSREEMLIKTAQHIMEKLPPTFNVQEFHAKYPTKYEESMNTVLVQEAVRYNRLLRFVQKSLSEFSKAVRGEVDMSAELEAVGSSFFINAVPASWAALAYPSLKPLSSWVEDLLRRVQFVQSWYDKGMPNALWMGGFFFPQAFLTGTLQNYARRKDVAIDSVSFNFSFLQDETPTTVAAPEQGAIVYGLYLEGARWDGAGRTLAESRPKELYVDVPLLHLDPVVDRVADPNDYICPVYKTLTRAGTLSTTGHSTNFVLSITIPTVAPPEHWIKRGVACVISLNF
ncbi:Cytoplasmic dynein 2 heavy chain (DYNC2H1), putative [Trypanosoma equiperdum]|uniref:Dynein heavy chain, putative n=1 Tax=Trypanosoma equiperdum TaxID=5694 RepID=A0A1G4IFQ5_TRYEQ|nr:Cytoplasmic dynein 2 heavy chain (DYNC2H1), putative [Trypanosoma equiperdum]